MKYILVSGVVVEERDPWGGIVDIDKLLWPADDQERELFDAINKALDNEGEWPGSSEVSMSVCGVDCFEKMPFTGIIEKEVIIYVE